MDELHKIENLLNQVAAINKKYEELARLSGENFNVFKILNVAENEVRLHSAFIAELLNPNGSHGLGDTFLKLFIQQIGFTGFACESAKVHVEKHVGRISEDFSEGGRIDLVIDDSKGRGIIIENKIYAGDQEKQLSRYSNYGKKRFPNGFKLHYLTLSEKELDEKNTVDSNGQPIAFETITYKNDIRLWLENCHKEAASHPILRETIKQYIHLINHLTNQAMNHTMEKELGKLLAQNKETIKAVYLISDNRGKMEHELLSKLKSQLEIIAAQLKLSFHPDGNFGYTKNVEEEAYLRFDLESYHNSQLSIYFGFLKGREEFFVGVAGENVTADNINHELKTKISDILSVKLEDECKKGEYANWHFLHYFKNDLRNWDTVELWQSIPDEILANRLKNLLVNIVNELKVIQKA